MSKKSIEDKFSIDMDAYFSGIEEHNKLESKEYTELLELGKTLADKDFSKYSNEKDIFNRTLKNINEYRGDNVMKKINKKRRNVAVASIAAVAMLSVSLMQTSFARNAVEDIIKSISLGHINVMQMETPKTDEVAVPENLKGKIFDKNGKVIESFKRGNSGKLYTASGEEIYNISNDGIVTVDEQEKMRKETVLEIKDANELNKHTCFNVSLPSYLPEGYKFDRGEVYKEKDETRVVKSKYIDLVFTNEKTGKNIIMQQRFADDETKYTAATDGKIEQVKVNGVYAVITEDSRIEWEANNTIYILSGKGEITKSELTKIADSIK